MNKRKQKGSTESKNSSKKSKTLFEQCALLETFSTIACDLKLPDSVPSNFEFTFAAVLNKVLAESKTKASVISERPWNMLIAIDDDNKVVHTHLYDERILRSDKIGYIPLRLQFVDPDPTDEYRRNKVKNTHTTALIIDFENRTFEYFEPYGYLVPWHDHVLQAIQTDVVDYEWPHFSLLDAEISCPRLGPQYKSQDKVGFCTWWTWLHIYLRILCRGNTSQIYEYLSAQGQEFYWKVLLGFYCYIQSIADKDLTRYLQFAPQFIPDPSNNKFLDFNDISTLIYKGDFESADKLITKYNQV